MKYMMIYKMFKGYSNKSLIKLREQLAARYLKLFDPYNYILDVETERVLYRFEVSLLKELRARGILPPEPDEEFIRELEPVKKPKRRYKNPENVRRYNRKYYYQNQQHILELRRRKKDAGL